MTTQTKVCTNPDCTQKNPQPITAFYNDITKADRLSPRCRTCIRTQQSERYARKSAAAKEDKLLAKRTERDEERSVATTGFPKFRGKRKRGKSGRRMWSIDECTYFEDWYGLVPDNRLAAQLGRTKSALYNHAYKMGIQKQDRVLTFRRVGRIFGVCEHSVRRWYAGGHLRAEPSKGYKAASNLPAWAIRDAWLEEFMRKCPHLYDYTKIDPDLYPTWYEIGRTATKAASLVRGGRCRRWEPWEDAYAVHHYKDTPIEEIAKKLGRSVGAVRSHVWLARNEGRMVPVRLRFSRKEDNFLTANYGKMSIADLARALSRPHRGTCRRLYKLRRAGKLPAYTHWRHGEYCKRKRAERRERAKVAA